MLTYIHVVMMLPILLTIGLNMSLPQKVGLIAILCLGAIIAVFAIIQAILSKLHSMAPINALLSYPGLRCGPVLSMVWLLLLFAWPVSKCYCRGRSAMLRGQIITSSRQLEDR